MSDLFSLVGCVLPVGQKLLDKGCWTKAVGQRPLDRTNVVGQRLLDRTKAVGQDEGCWTEAVGQDEGCWTGRRLLDRTKAP